MFATHMSSNGRAHGSISTEGRLASASEVAGLRKGIVLMGMKHCGKSTLGHALAQTRGIPFIDLDELTEREFDPARSLSCREIAARHGEKLFRTLEERAAVRLADMIAGSRSDGVGLVAALGGGTVESVRAMDALARVAVLVYLEESVELLYTRVMERGLPSYLDPSDPRASFFAIFARRSPLFSERAHLVVHLMGMEIEQAFSELVRVLSEAGYAR